MGLRLIFTDTLSSCAVHGERVCGGVGLLDGFGELIEQGHARVVVERQGGFGGCSCGGFLIHFLAFQVSLESIQE